MVTMPTSRTDTPHDPAAPHRPEDGWVHANGAGVVHFATMAGFSAEDLPAVVPITDGRLGDGLAEAFDRVFTVDEIDRIAEAIGVDDPRAIARDPAHYETALLQMTPATDRQRLMVARLRTGRMWKDVVADLRPTHHVSARTAESWERLGTPPPSPDILTDVLQVLGADPAPDNTPDTIGTAGEPAVLLAASLRGRALQLLHVAGRKDVTVWVTDGTRLLLTAPDTIDPGIVRLIGHHLGVVVHRATIDS